METNSMADGLRKVFMAGVGAMAAAGERGGQVLDDLAERGETVVKQGKDLNQELVQKGVQATSGIREDLLRARLAGMTPEQRAQFIALAQKLAAELDAQDAQHAAEEAKDEIAYGSAAVVESETTRESNA